MRLFFGIGVPERMRPEIARVQSLLRPAGADVRWVRPANAHLTLRFLGEVDAAEVARIDGAARSALAGREPSGSAGGVPSLRLRGLGCFPDRGPLSVVWVGIDGDVDHLDALHRRLDASLAELGFAPERKRFHPHVTLGRVRRRRSERPRSGGGREGERALRAALAEHREVELGDWRVRELTLFESRLSSAGAEYRAAARYPLA